MPNTKAMKPSIINASTDTQRITNNTKKASEASNVFFALSFGSLFFFDLMKYTIPSTSKTKNNRNKIISTSPSLDNYIVVLSIKRCIE